MVPNHSGVLGQPLSIYQAALTSPPIHSLEMYLLAPGRKLPSQIENFTLQDLAIAQLQHDVSSKVIFALEAGDETSLLPLYVSFS